MSIYRRLPGLLVVVLGGMLLAFTFGALDTHALLPINGAAASIDPAAPVPAFKHIFVIVLENKEYEQVIGSPQSPYINSLARRYGLATHFYGARHPSLPNYLAMIGGDTFGIDSNCTNCTVDQPNLVDQLEAGRKSWKAYMESMPSPCFVGDSGKLYRQKHNPFIYFDSIRNNPARCNKIVPFTQFTSDLATNTLPNFVWITPDMCNAAHDCPIDTADTWLKTTVPAILASPAWKNGGALFITFDEGESDAGCCGNAAGGRIATLVISPLGRPGFKSEVPYTHYSLLRTIETAWGLPLLGNAGCRCAPTMADFFAR
jgi:acid phosphatase